MIHIQRTERPAQLTEELQKKLTEDYIADNKKDVWNKPFIRDALLLMSQYKCCYCERKIGAGTAEMHIDHFRPKSLYPQGVVEWENLLPSCADCNRSKQAFNPEKEPMVNPCEDDPRQLFYLDNFRYKSLKRDRNCKANITIAVLGLNDFTRHCLPRFQITEALLDKVEEVCDLAKERKDNINTDSRLRNKIIRSCRDILEKCISSAEYSAFAATALQGDQDYLELKKILRDSGSWSDELEKLDRESLECVFKQGS